MAISAAAVIRQRHHRANKLVTRMLGEEYDEDAMNMVNPELTGKGPPTDTGIIYWPGFGTGVMLYGPITVGDMIRHFFKETLPSIMPEMAAYKDQPIRQLTDMGLTSGMIGFFGEKEVINQVLSRRPRVKLPDGGSAVEDAFDSAESSVIHFTGFNTCSTVNFGSFAPQLKWLVT